MAPSNATEKREDAPLLSSNDDIGVPVHVPLYTCTEAYEVIARSPIKAVGEGRISPRSVYEYTEGIQTIQSGDGHVYTYTSDQHHMAIHVLHETHHLAPPSPSKDSYHSREFDDERNGHVPKTILSSMLDGIKCLASMAFLVSCIYVCTTAIITRQAVGTELYSDAGLFAYITVFWILILWLAEMEGSQSCLVGLQPVPKELFQVSHPLAYKSTLLAHWGDNMERFIVGRQFLIVFVVFVTNSMAAPKPFVSVWGLNDRITHLLLDSGIAVTANAVMLGQVAQINAASCMLDFVNTYFGLFTTYVSLILDSTGFLHFVYLVQIVFATFTGKAVESNEPPRNFWRNLVFWSQITFSCFLLAYFCAMTLVALYYGQTTMWPGVPETASVIITCLLMIFVGLLEGMQIALFAVVNLPSDETDKHKWAAKSCELTFSGSNLEAFLIGRQVLVTLSMFILARIMTCDVHMELGEPTIFGVSKNLQRFFNTGMPGAVITSLIGSLSWRIIASSFPVAFLDLRLNYWIIKLCLVVELSGVCQSTWVLAMVQKKIMGYELDEMYIGTPEDREADKACIENKCSELRIETQCLSFEEEEEEKRCLDREVEKKFIELEHMRQPQSQFSGMKILVV